MPELRNLLLNLRAGDEHLAAVTPGADLEARFRARLRAEARSTRKAERTSGRRLQRPLVLAFAACAAGIVLASSAPPTTEPAELASSPSAAEAVSPDKARADGGPLDPALNHTPARRAPMIHAPALQELPARPFKKGPGPARPITPSTKVPSGSSDAEMGSGVPGTPKGPASKDERNLALPPGGSLPSAPPAPTRPAGSPQRRGALSSHESEAPAKVTPPEPPPMNGTPSPTPQPQPQPRPDILGYLGDGVTCQDNASLKQQAQAICGQNQLLLVNVEYDYDCPGARSTKAFYACSAQPVSFPPDTCTDGVVGDDVTCHDVYDLVDQAQAICDQSSLWFFSWQDLPGCAEGQAAKLGYSCCVPPTPPPPPVNSCIGGSLGDSVTCQSYDAIEQQVDALCAQAGLIRSSFKPSLDCPGYGSTSTAYSCCPTTLGESLPPGCIEGRVGDGVTCKDISVLAQQAAPLCAQAGLSLVAASSDKTCFSDMSLVTRANYLCCPPSLPACP